MPVASVDARWEKFTLDEWFRLERIAQKFEPKMRLAYNRAVVNGRTVNKLHIRNIITDIFIEAAWETAEVYSLVFNPNSPIYARVIDELTDQYAAYADSAKAREAVRAIVPMDLQLGEIRRRLSLTFGLDARSALMIERYRQTKGISERDVERARRAAILERGNRMAITEVNRSLNAALDSLWKDNMGILKADYPVEYTMEYFQNLPNEAEKVWVTRRDNKVDKVCKLLEGLRTNVGDWYDTEYGVFLYPPIHPFCRCRLVLLV